MKAAPAPVIGELLSSRRLGAFHQISATVPGVAAHFRPGTLVAVTVEGAATARLGRRAFPIARARVSAYGGTVEFVLDPTEPGETWLAAAPAGTKLDVVAPLGRPFALPKEPADCLLVGADHHAAPLIALAERLRERRCDVRLVLGASTEQRIVGLLEARRVAGSVTVATEDGSLGIRGDVVTQVARAIQTRTPQIVYVAAPAPIAREVAHRAEEVGAWSQVLLPRDPASLPCATGLCHTCLVDVLAPGDVVRQVRACREGPVFRGDRLVWERSA